MEGVTDTELYPGHYDFHRSDMWRGYDVGKQLKSTQGWFTRTNGENRSGFSALPGGMRGENGDFVAHEYDGYFWTSNSTKYESGSMRKLSYNYDGSWRSSVKKSCGLYVRCIKNEE